MSFRRFLNIVYVGIATSIIIFGIDLVEVVLSTETALKYEWFLYYQIISFYIILFGIPFSVIYILIELVIYRYVSGIKRYSKYLLYTFSLFYILVYNMVWIVNHYLLPEIPFTDIRTLLAGIGTLVVMCGGYFYMIKYKLDLLARFLSGRIVSLIIKIIDDITYYVVFFIIFSFIIDIIYIYYIPSTSAGNGETAKPNIIVITLDTVRADHLSVYNYSRDTTPNLRKIAEKSVVFENAISPAPWTLPAHSSIFTGKLPFQHNATMNNQILKEDEKTLAEILKENGYITAGFIGGTMCKARYGVAQGFDYYNDRLRYIEIWYFGRFRAFMILHAYLPRLLDLDMYETPLHVPIEKSAEAINRDIFRWFKKNRKRPFFMFINYFDAHDPYLPEDSFKSEYTNKSFRYRDVYKMLDIEQRYGNVSEEILEYTKALYDAEIRYLDFYIGQLFDFLKSNSLLNNTVVIITADHGEEFYEHGGYYHAFTLYNELLHVPLLIYYPKMFGHKQVSELVSTVDLFSTVLDLAGIEYDSDDIYSESLLPIIRNSTGKRRYIIAQRASVAGVYDPKKLKKSKKVLLSQLEAIYHGEWKLIYVKPPIDVLPNSLFNVTADPYERNNLYDIKPSVVRELSELFP